MSGNHIDSNDEPGHAGPATKQAAWRRASLSNVQGDNTAPLSTRPSDSLSAAMPSMNGTNTSTKLNTDLFFTFEDKAKKTS